MAPLVPTELQIHRKNIKNYRNSIRHFIITSRFNNNTWYENENYRKNHPTIGCIYCSPDPISQNIPEESILFVLEMNNDTNQIMGIGMIEKKLSRKQHYVYNENNYNRYIHVGKHRISRDMMTEEEERIMKVFDILCFTGNRHMKRGQGLKSFPIDMLYRCSKRIDLVKFISEMFKTRLSKTNNQNNQT
jgi:hypothetical protein